MTESNAPRGPDDRTEGAKSSERNLVNIVYILYLASQIFGVTAVITIKTGGNLLFQRCIG